MQHALVALLELYHQNVFSLEKIVEKACHNPALRYKINKRGFLREGYFADLTLVNLDAAWKVEKDNILYKCGWSPFENTEFKSRVEHVFINGNHAYNKGIFSDIKETSRLDFIR